jgi:hypothetical protein
MIPLAAPVKHQRLTTAKNRADLMDIRVSSYPERDPSGEFWTTAVAERDVMEYWPRSRVTPA